MTLAQPATDPSGTAGDSGTGPGFRPILVVSSERSGSNLLRRMLAAHPLVAGPPPPHLWRHLSEIAPSLGDLRGDGALDRLIEAALALTRVERSHLRWPHPIGAAEVRRRLVARNLSGVAGALYEAYAAREGAGRCVVKENRLWEHAHRIRAVFPAARVVYLCRDGRDVACSLRRVPSHDQHVYFLAREWASEQRGCLGVLQDLAPVGGSHLLRYEDLLRNPETTLRELCAFLDLPFDAAMLEHHRSAQARREARASTYWSNLARPLLRDNSGSFRRELSRRQLALFEALAAPELAALGYTLAAPPRPPRLGRLARGWYALSNAWSRRRQRRALAREPGRRERAEALQALARLRSDAPAQRPGLP